MVLQLIFGMTMYPAVKSLRFAMTMRIIITVQKQDPLSKITMPSNEKLKEQWAMIQNGGMMDGLKISIEEAPDEMVHF